MELESLSHYRPHPSLPHYHPHPQIHIGRYGAERGWLQRMSLGSPPSLLLRRQGRWRVGRRTGAQREIEVERAMGVGREGVCFKKLEHRGSCRGMP